MATESFPENHTMEQTPLAAAWRFRWLVALFALLGAVLAFGLAQSIDSTQYRATASLVVTDPRATTLFSADDAAQLSASRYVDDQIAILGSDSIAQRTGEIITAAEPGLAVDTDDIAEKLRIIGTGSSEILVGYTAADENTAVTTVNTVISAYEQLRRESAERESASAVAQLEQSLASIDAELDDIENQIQALLRNPEQSELETQRSLAIARLLELQPQMAATEDEDELVILRNELADIDQLLATLATIEVDVDGNPRLVQLYSEQLQAVERRSSLAEQRDQLLVDTELLSGGISLSSPARFAREMRIATTAIAILGGFAGLVAGSGFAYLLALRRRKFAQRSQPGWILQTPLLAEVPIFGEEGIKSELPILEYPASASAEAFRFAATALELQEQRTENPDLPRLPRSHTLLITSAGPSEGKTVVTANLALAAARKGHSVLAIDADFGNQRLSELLRDNDGRDDPGLTEVVEAGLDLDAATFSLGEPGPLQLLSRGNRPTNAPDFFSLPATSAFIAKVGGLFDLVLIDGPPMLHIAYASLLAQYVDRIVVVTRHGGSVSHIEDLAQRLDLVGTPLVGYVYNGAPLRYEMMLTEGSLKDVLGEGSMR